MVAVPLLHWADNKKGCLNRNDFDHESYGDANAHAYPGETVLSDGHQSSYEADRDPALEHPCVELKKVLSGGTFYYSVEFDLTNRLQNRYAYA
jgi:hypothetical protein